MINLANNGTNQAQQNDYFLRYIKKQIQKVNNYNSDE
jgi:hypothetical protein